MRLQFSAGESSMAVNENYLSTSQWVVGKTKVKQELSLGWLSALINPPWFSEIFWQMASPIPVSLNALIPCSFSKGRKIRSLYFSSKPIPGSSTETSQLS